MADFRGAKHAGKSPPGPIGRYPVMVETVEGSVERRVAIRHHHAAGDRLVIETQEGGDDRFFVQSRGSALRLVPAPPELIADINASDDEDEPA